MKHTPKIVLLVVASLAVGLIALAQDTPSLQVTPETTPADAPATDVQPADEAALKIHTVATKRVKVDVGLDGVFEAATMTPLVLRPEVYGSFVVERAIPSGTVVKKGDQVLWLDTEEIDRQIADFEASEALTKLALRQTEIELQFLEKTNPAQLAWAERSKRIADEEQADHEKLVLPHEDEYYELDKRSHVLYMEATEEEFKQLEEMYKADELVEPTEGIVLKRNKLHLDRARLGHQVGTVNVQQRPEQELRRNREQVARNYADAELAWERAQLTIPMELDKKRLQWAQMQRDRQRTLDRITELKADREAMIVRASADGVVYYGQCIRGQWPTAGALDGALRRGGRVSANQIFMTIVQPNGLFVRAGAPEAELHNLKTGLPVRITPTGYPDHKFNGSVSDVIILPPGPGQFTVKVALEGDRGPIMPGMTCKLKVTAYDEAAAIVAPASAVFTDTYDDEVRYVYVVGADGEPVKRTVTVGRLSGDDLEILDGLQAGEQILPAEPAEDD